MVSGIPMTKARSIFVVAVLLANALPAFAQDGAVVGRIKSAAGSVVIVRQNASIPAQVGQPLLLSDSVRTGADGHVGITLKDETRLALGPNTDVRIDQFAYSPGQGSLGMVMKIARGSRRLCVRQDRETAPLMPCAWKPRRRSWGCAGRGW